MAAVCREARYYGANATGGLTATVLDSSSVLNDKFALWNAVHVLGLPMAEVRTVITLKFKRNEITRAIVNYENKIAQAKVGVAHINAAIRIFEIGEDVPAGRGQHVAPYVDIYRMFRRGEMAPFAGRRSPRGR